MTRDTRPCGCNNRDDAPGYICRRGFMARGTAAGGPAAVTAFLHARGITGMSVDRSTAGFMYDFYGFKSGQENISQALEFSLRDPAAAAAPRPGQGVSRACLRRIHLLRTRQAQSVASPTMPAWSRCRTDGEWCWWFSPEAARLRQPTATAPSPRLRGHSMTISPRDFRCTVSYQVPPMVTG
jgi:hypothetical protein